VLRFERVRGQWVDEMQRWLILILTPVAFAVTAAPQFSQSECQKLNDERREVRKQLRQPYTKEQGAALRAKEKDLLRILTLHCKQPANDPPALVKRYQQALQPLP
jgi:hypothetical protein